MEWNACTQEPNAFLCWIECHSATVSAVQAALLLLTVIVAIAIPLASSYFHRKNSENEREDTSAAFTASLIGPAAAASMDSARSRSLLNAITAGTVPRKHVDDFKIYLPRYLEAAMLRMHEVNNNAVAPMRTAISGIIAFNAFADQASIGFRNEFVKDTPERRERILRQLSDNLDKTREALTRAINDPEDVPDKKIAWENA